MAVWCICFTNHLKYGFGTCSCSNLSKEIECSTPLTHELMVMRRFTFHLVPHKTAVRGFYFMCSILMASEGNLSCGIPCDSNNLQNVVWCWDQWLLVVGCWWGRRLCRGCQALAQRGMCMVWCCMCNLVAIGDRDILWLIIMCVGVCVTSCVCAFIWLKCANKLVDRFIGPLLFEAL